MPYFIRQHAKRKQTEKIMNLADKQVLLVDDQPANLDRYMLVLQRIGVRDLNISQTINGMQASVELLTSRPDLIITDWNMPITDGLEYVKRLREVVKTEAQVVMVTAADEKRMAEVEPYVDGWLQKPYTLSDFETVIRSVMATATEET